MKIVFLWSIILLGLINNIVATIVVHIFIG